MKIGTIAAVVVTFNRAELLDQVLASLSKQNRLPNCIIVINNCSTDNTIEVIENHKKNDILNIDLVNLEKNIGGAGGFYVGTKKCYEDGYDAVWFMDDDTLPREDALQCLEQDLVQFESDTNYKPGFICSTVLWKNDDLCEMNIPVPVWDWTRFLHTKHQVGLVESCSFVSVLVRREKIKSAGYPIPEFFIWYDDTEYTQRLSAQGYPGLVSIRSRVHHHLVENKGVNYSMINEKNFWKYKYGIRNQGAVVLKKYGWPRFLHFAITRLYSVMKLDIEKSVKIELIKSCWSAIRFKYAIEYPETQ